MIRLYDTKQHRKVEFAPLEDGKVSMYVCGPTVYNRIHIGNARTFISFDMVRRYLEWRGFEVTFVQNVTDVDDKIIARAAEEGTEPAELAARYIEAFISDMHTAGVKDPTVRPKATEEIPEMIALVETLVEKGHAYEADGDVYFSVRSDQHYGSLSGRNIDEMEEGHRTLRGDAAQATPEADGNDDATSKKASLLGGRKRDPLDFALWKASKPGEPSWDSPWGPGRPGWHIECSAMSEKYLGLPFDIHGGGSDLVFPHHENECAQSRCASGKDFARHWMHSGMLQINSEKMSKSLGNFVLLHDVLETSRACDLRMLMLQTHYRSPLDFSDARMEEANTAVTRIENAIKNIDWLISNAEADAADALDHDGIAEAIDVAREAFTSAMDDDFNSPAALGAIFTLVGDINAVLNDKSLSTADAEALAPVRETIIDLLSVLGIDLSACASECEDASQDYPAEVIALATEIAGYDGSDKPAAIDALLQARAAARAEKNWDVADQVRDGLSGLGFAIEDTPQGARVTYAG